MQCTLVSVEVAHTHLKEVAIHEKLERVFISKYSCFITKAMSILCS